MAGIFWAASGQTALAADYQGPNVDEFVAEMTRDYGFASEQLLDLFAQAERKQAILDAISRPAERVKPWKEYRPIFITDSRIATPTQCTASSSRPAIWLMRSLRI